jgi:hypothetical protein
MISLSISSQIFPAVFPYFYDFMIIACAAITFLKKNLRIRYLILVFSIFFLQLVIIFSHLIKYSNSGIYIPILIFSDLRPFIIVAFLFSLPKIKDVKKTIIFITYFIIIANFMINLVAFIDQNTYSNFILKFFGSSYSVGSLNDVYGHPTSVSYVASLQDRFCGFFLQPVNAGMVNAFLLLYLFVLKKNMLIGFFPFVILFLMTLFNGYSSLSSAFILSFLLWFAYFIPIHKYFFFYAVLGVSILTFIFSIIDVDTLIFLLDLYVTSGRYGDDSHIVNLFRSIDLNLIDYLFGFNLEIKGFYGKGLGDSGLFIKFINGGLIYVSMYYYFIYKIYKIFIINTPDKSLVSATFLYMLLLESGTNGFSLPQVSIIIYGLLFLFNIQFSDVNSANSDIQKKQRAVSIS